MLKNLNRKLTSVLALSLCVSCQSPKLGVHTQEGIDISHHQDDKGEIDWNQINASDKKFIISKASEGATYQDPTFVQHWERMSDDIQRGAYHFLRFSSSTPEAQMENFLTQLRKAGGWTNKTIVALDVEEHKDTPPGGYALVGSVTEASVQYLKDQANLTPYVYTRETFWDPYVTSTPEIVKECPLWIARWRNVEPSPEELPKGWNKWTIWQYTDQGSVPGITGNVDLNKMKCNAEDQDLKGIITKMEAEIEIGEKISG